MRRGRCGTSFRTRNLGSALAEIEHVDALVLVRSIYRPMSTGYAPYIDNTVHTVMEHWPPWAPGGRRFTARALSAEGEYLRNAICVFTASRVVAQSVTEYHGVPEDRVTVVGGGSHFAPVSGDESGREPMLLFAGYDFHRKGGDLLVRAFRIVRHEIPDCRLVIVGPQMHTDEPRVECLGPVRDRAVIADLMTRAGVFVLPARFEPYGMVLLEAMAHGAPCVGTAVGAIPEIIDHGSTGLIVSPDDESALAATLIRVLSDHALAKRLGAAGREKVASELNWPIVARKIVYTLNECVSL
jgi:glycosyltransferase involved in cell wall biosynthesis